VLDLEHRALARFVRRVLGLRNDAVESRVFELVQPFRRDRPIARDGRQVDGRRDVSQQTLELGAPLAQRPVDQRLSASREQMECDEGRRRLLRRARNAIRAVPKGEVCPGRGRISDLALAEVA